MFEMLFWFYIILYLYNQAEVILFWIFPDLCLDFYSSFVDFFASDVVPFEKFFSFVIRLQELSLLSFVLSYRRR